MPIPVVCTGCQTRLSAPDAAAGRSVQCPKCRAVLPIPAAAAPPPTPDSSAPEDPFAFGDSPEEPRPNADRGRGDRHHEPKKKPLGLIIGVAAAALLICCAVGGYGAYLVYQRVTAEAARPPDPPAENTGGKAAPPAPKKKGPGPDGWVEFRPADGSFKAYFPGLPRETVAPDDPAGPADPASKLTTTTYDCGSTEVYAAVAVMKFPPGIAVTDRQRTELYDAVMGAYDGRPEEVTWLGRKGAQVVGKEKAPAAGGPKGESFIFVARVVMVGNVVYIGMLGTVDRRSPELERGFFDTTEANPR